MIEKQKRLSGLKVQKRDNLLVQDRLKGATYLALSEKYGIKTSNISRILNKPEMKEVIDVGTAHIVSLIPMAVDIQYQAMEDTNEKGKPTPLAQKASELILKTGAIVPSNVTNQTINNIFNIQNNVTLAPGVAKAMGFALNNNDEDVIDV